NHCKFGSHSPTGVEYEYSGVAAMVEKGSWSSEDWEEYRSLPWLGRRMADIARLLPVTEPWLAPLIGLHAEHVQKRTYKAHRRAAKPTIAPTRRRATKPKPGRSMRQ